MGNSEGEAVKAIVHYQECLEKYARREDENKMLYCIGKLWKLPVTIEHLTNTGVGRTVNSLRKINGDVGERAKALVAKWKDMVAREEDDEEIEETDFESSLENKTDDSEVQEEETMKLYSNDEAKKRSSSNSKQNDKKPKNDVKESSTKNSSRDKDEDDKKHKDRDTKHNSKRDADNKHKHKSSKRKHEDNNDKHSSKKTHKHESDSDDHKSSTLKRKHENNKDKVSKLNQKSENGNNHRHTTHIDKKYKASGKKKYASEDEEDNQDEDESSDETEVRNKHSSREHKEDKHKKEDYRNNKSSRSSKDKDKSKHSSNKEKDISHSKGHSNSSGNKDQTSKKVSNSTKSKGSVAVEIGSGSGTSFAEALGMLEPSSSKNNKKKVTPMRPLPIDNGSSGSNSPEETMHEVNLLNNKNLEPLNINIASLLPEITPNYKPIAHPLQDAGYNRNKISAEDETLSAIMYNKISRTKVYSGNKTAWGIVPSLFDLCIRVLQDNIDALEFTGGVPYSILRPILERANYNQLFMLEQYNPYLLEDTDGLWKVHCQRDFRTKAREEMETWRDMYQRCLDERECKLRALTANIKIAQDKSIPVRQTKLAYVDSVVKPPRNVARKQAKHGTGGVSSPLKKPAVTPSSRLVALATSGPAGEIAVPNPGPRAATASSGPAVVMKPKKAPLMQKTLALMKNRFRR